MRTFHTTLFLLIALSVSAQPFWKVESNTNVRLNAVSFPSSQVGYIGGDDSVLLKTNNSGLTWQRITTNGIQFTTAANDFIHLSFTDKDHGYAILGDANLSGMIYKTSNGGQNWELDSNLTFCFPKTAYFFDFDNGVVAGLDCFWNETMQRKSNGNYGLVQRLDVNMGQISCIDFLNANFGLAGGYSNYIIRTTDGGANWDTVRSTLSGTPITDIEIINDTLAYATFGETGSTGILISTDGGLSWLPDWSGTTFLYPGYNCITSVSDERIFAGGQSGSSTVLIGYMLYQKGMSYFAGSVEQVIWDIADFGDSTVFAVGDSGFIYTNLDSTMLPSGVDVPEESENFRVYPNPASDVVHIDLPESADLHLSLYDLRGKKCMEQSLLSVTNHTLDIATLDPGIYFLNLQSDSKKSTIRLMKH